MMFELIYLQSVILTIARIVPKRKPSFDDVLFFLVEIFKTSTEYVYILTETYMNTLLTDIRYCQKVSFLTTPTTSNYLIKTITTHY